MKKKWTTIFALTALCLSTMAFTPPEIGHAAVDQQLTAQKTISKEEAKEIAQKQVKGRVLYVDLDRDDGVLKYEVIILTDKDQVYEVEINANTGQVIKVEQEND